MESNRLNIATRQNPTILSLANTRAPVRVAWKATRFMELMLGPHYSNWKRMVTDNMWL